MLPIQFLESQWNQGRKAMLYKFFIRYKMWDGMLSASAGSSWREMGKSRLEKLSALGTLLGDELLASVTGCRRCLYMHRSGIRSFPSEDLRKACITFPGLSHMLRFLWCGSSWLEEERSIIGEEPATEFRTALGTDDAELKGTFFFFEPCVALRVEH